MTIYQPHSGFDLLENEHINLRERIAGVPLKWDSVGGVPLERNTEPVAHAGNLGFVSYSGLNRVANLKVSQYDGTVLYENDFSDDALNAIPDGFAQWGVLQQWGVLHRGSCSVTFAMHWHTVPDASRKSIAACVALPLQCSRHATARACFVPPESR